MNFARGRYLRPGLWLAASGLVAVPMAAPAVAQNTPGQVQLELNNTPLSAAIDLLTQRSGARIIVVDPPSLAGKTVTVSLSGMSVENALNSILTASKTPWYKGDDGVFYINATPPVLPVVAPPPAPPVPSPIITTERIELRHQTPMMVIRALGLDRSFPLEPAIEHAQGILATSGLNKGLKAGGVMGGADMQSVDVNGRKWDIWSGNVYMRPTDADTNAAVQSLFDANGDSAGRDAAAVDSAGQVAFPRGRTRGFPGGQGQQFPGGQPGVTAPGGAPGTGAPGGTGNALQNNQNTLIPDGITSIFPYQEDNSLLVRGESDAIGELKGIIQLLDVPVRQVSIKAEFVTVSDGAADAFGLNWTATVLNSNASTDIGGGGTTSSPTFVLNVGQGNVQATLQALKQENRAKTILAPLVSTLNNVPAMIESNEQYPIWQQNVLQGNLGGGNITTSQANYIQTSTGLEVLPRINRDGSVTVQITPQVEQINGFVEGPNRQTAPILIRQRLSTVRRVRSGESIVLGGLQTKTESTTSRGIPFLQDLPFIGKLFRSRNNNSQNSQLLIFLTPTIVEEDSGAQVSPG